MAVGFISKEYRWNVWVCNEGLRISVLALGGCVELEERWGVLREKERNNRT